MSLMLSLSLAVSLAAGATHAPLRAGSEPLEPALEARVQRLGKGLRCPVCQGLSIADSNSASARAQLDKLRELVAAGKTDEEIRAYFVARYGEWALLEPTVQGANLLVWFAPALLLVIGAVLVVRYVRRPPRAAAPTAAASAPPAPPAATSGDPYLDAVRAELER